MYHRKFSHITGNMDDIELESGKSDLDSYAATVRTCWSVKAYSGESLASVIIVLSVAKRQRLLPSLDSCSPFVSLL